MEKLVEYDQWIKKILVGIPNLIDSLEINEVETKSGERDLVTIADRKVETYLTENILNKFPDHAILGEESYEEDKIYDRCNLWVIDPIDGTTNFVKQGENFATMITFFHKGEPCLAYIYDIKKGSLLSSIRGHGVYLDGKKLEVFIDLSLKESLISTNIRRISKAYPKFFHGLVESSFGIRAFGSAGIDGWRVAAGKLGAYINYRGGPWDYAPFLLIAKELGLVLKDLNSEDIKLEGYSSFILAHPKVYEDMHELLRNIK